MVDFITHAKKEQNMKQKFEYFLNAIHYSLFVMDKKLQITVNECIQDFLYSIFEFFGHEETYNTRIKNTYNDKKVTNFLYGKKTGLSTYWAHHWFGYFYCGYPALLSFILTALVIHYFGKSDKLILLFTMGIPTGMGYIPAYMAVFHKDRYLNFFKKYEKKDEHWHRKWKWITVAFCIGAIITEFIIGGLIMFYILIQ